MSDLLIVIPAYNEEKNIERVVDRLIRDFPQYDYLVINDGSKDRTGEICRERGYEFLDLPVNLGLAGGFQAGLKYAAKKGYRYAVQLDGVNVVFIESPEAALSAYNSGEIDAMADGLVATQAIEQYGDSDELKAYDLIGTRYYDFNCSKEYLSDPRVRQALAMAIRDLRLTWVLPVSTLEIWGLDNPVSSASFS